MISQLGSVIEVKRHCGWTGNVETSWKTVANAQSSERKPTIEFRTIVPLSLGTSPASKTVTDIDGNDSILYWVDLTTEMAFYLPRHPPVLTDSYGSEMRVLIVWLEEFRDDLDSILPGQ